MGIPSPFVGAAGSPVLGRSKQATPEQPLLETFDEFKGLEVFELCPPHIDVQKAKVFSAWDSAPEAPPKLERFRTMPVPAWPSHLPDYLNQATELNTFLEVPEFGMDAEEPPRRRAGSDFTGLRELTKEEVDVRLEDLFKPLPPAEAGPAAEAAAWQDAAYEQQWCWMVPDEVNGGWMMMYDNTCQDPSQMWPAQSQGFSEEADSIPRFPPLPPAEEAYKPKWVYGSSWPFNHAPTTLILDNLPEELTQTEFLAVLDASGFHGLYDFVFLPASLRSGRSQGNAIVNLTRHSYGLALAARAQGFAEWGPSYDGSRCEVKWSLPLQGIVEHIENYRNHPANHESVPDGFRPAHFVNGWQVPFPSPTRRLRAPRLGFR
uniref:RRM domain-containing protein n=1 Tax=Alexandrium monilatum TaxID=311494 RepID=A0A7S4VAR6_9DINO|mmetsp:Transcript_80330/g.247703  ORF Transcript_80330/g.247703 Transcript_80330/m.247703 type:complete len:375 (+) Transcript_80330:106-1230(+)